MILTFRGAEILEFGFCQACRRAMRRISSPICSLHGDFKPCMWQLARDTSNFLTLDERSQIQQHYGVDLHIDNLTVDEFWMCDTCGKIYRKVDYPCCPEHPDQLHGDNADADILQVMATDITPEERDFLQDWINREFQEGDLMGFPDFNLPDDPLILGGPLL